MTEAERTAENLAREGVSVGKAIVDRSTLDTVLQDTHDPLLDAAKEGSLEKIRRVVERGQNIHVKHQRGDSKGMTALHWVAGDGRVQCAQYLLEKGARVSDKDEWGQTPLHHAAYNGHVEMVNLLLQHGADLHDRDAAWGQTALHWAALNCNQVLMDYLISEGARLDEQDLEGHTPLHLLAKGGCTNAMRQLVGKGASTTILAKDGKSAEALAKASGHEDARHFLATLRKAKGVALRAVKEEQSRRRDHLRCLYVAPMTQWSVDEVSTFLDYNGLGDYVSMFRSRGVDGAQLHEEGGTLVLDAANRRTLNLLILKAHVAHHEAQQQAMAQADFDWWLAVASPCLLLLALIGCCRRIRSISQ